MNTILLSAIETHTSGEPFRIVTNGLPKRIPGKTLLEKRKYIEKHYDFLRNAIMREPRGHYDMFGGYLLDSTDPKLDSDASIIFMNPAGYTDQCGHGMIAVTTALVQNGWIDQSKYKLKPELMRVRLETTVGIVDTYACWNGTKVEFVRFDNTPVFILYEDISVETSVGRLTGDIVFNGAFNYFVEVNESTLALSPENAKAIKELGYEIKTEIQKRSDLQIFNKDYPQIRGLHGVDFINVKEKKDMSDENVPNQKSCLVLGVKQVDRSPCGSGTAGRTALLYLKGRLELHNRFVNQSLIGGIFRASVKEIDLKANKGERDAVIVSIEGTAHIMGTSTWSIDLQDTIGLNGFIVSH